MFPRGDHKLVTGRKRQRVVLQDNLREHSRNPVNRPRAIKVRHATRAVAPEGVRQDQGELSVGRFAQQPAARLILLTKNCPGSGKAERQHNSGCTQSASCLVFTFPVYDANSANFT